MKPEEEGGSKAGIVLSASPLFTGDAGSGPSNIRRWLFEKDVIDCIVKLPVSIFYRTGINTYLWCLSTKKTEERKGMIQLIDASECQTSLRKNQGNKRYEISDEDREWIIDTYINGHDHGKSVLVPKETFMFRKVTTRRPLHMKIFIDPTEGKLNAFFEANKPLLSATEEQKEHIKDVLAYHTGDYDYSYANTLAEQKTIVSYLDSKCAAIDKAIEKHKKIIEKLEEV